MFFGIEEHIFVMSRRTCHICDDVTLIDDLQLHYVMRDPHRRASIWPRVRGGLVGFMIKSFWC